MQADAAISHVMLVHCETSTGMLNPLDEVASLCRALGRGLLVDAVASFGANPIDAASLGADAIILSSYKCMQGVPGCGWALIRSAALETADPGRRSLSLDLRDQGRHMDATGQFRFMPPTQVLAAFAQACREHSAASTKPRAAARPGCGATRRTGAAWSTACARWGSTPRSPTPAPRPSSPPSTTRPTRPSRSKP
ncbi:MAG: aminotransferase class V-fold PLP-dependent enzyme [Janthinobacterium lividum]